MKNQREIYKALWDGEILIHNNNNSVKAMLGADGCLCNENGQLLNLNFMYYEDWQIYKEPKWEDNIPDGGVLCWVSDSERDNARRYMRTVLKKDSKFWCADGVWIFATPLTKQEIQVFMDNVQEDLLVNLSKKLRNTHILTVAVNIVILRFS